jgi:hypothetical protein
MPAVKYDPELIYIYGATGAIALFFIRGIIDNRSLECFLNNYEARESCAALSFGAYFLTGILWCVFVRSFSALTLAVVVSTLFHDILLSDLGFIGYDLIGDDFNEKSGIYAFFGWITLTLGEFIFPIALGCFFYLLFSRFFKKPLSRLN